MTHPPLTCDATPGRSDPIGPDLAEDAAIDIVLRIQPDGRPAFTAAPSRHHDGEDDAPQGTGFRAWIHRTYRRFQDATERSEGGVGRQTRRLFDWLRSFVSPDEPMLRRLRRAGEIRLHHPPTMAHDEARSAWDAYLAGRRRHHAIWLAADAVVSVLTIPLAVLPGPNVFGYWFVYRAACHALALLGIRRAKRQAAATSYQTKA